MFMDTTMLELCCSVDEVKDADLVRKTASLSQIVQKAGQPFAGETTSSDF